MSRDRFDVLERFAPLFEAPEPPFEGFLRRRDRKRRNQRITAGVVGIALFAAVVWIRTAGLPFDRPSRPAGGGGTATGTTGPEVTPMVPPDAGWVGLQGAPPEGAVPSTPVTGEVIAEFAEIHVGWVFVYADGRVIWMPDASPPESALRFSILELRLTPAGVDLVRSGALPPETFLHQPMSLPGDAFEDPEIKTFVPSRYAVCFNAGFLDPSRAVGLLPGPAQALLRGKERTYRAPHFIAPHGERCSEVTTEEVFALAQIFNLSFEHLGGPVYDFSLGPDDAAGLPIELDFHPILPHGTWVVLGG
jgi:hypothetical protein